MKKVSVDGLLLLKPEEIKIVYLRCRGETVEKIAKKIPMAASAIYKVLKENIYPVLKVEGIDDIKAELSRPLLGMVFNLEELNNWPEGFREKIEALREPLEPQIEPSTIIESSSTTSQATLDSQKQSESNTESASTTSSSQTLGSQQTAGIGQKEHAKNPPPWLLVAIPILVVCILCIAATPFFWGMIERNVNAIFLTQVAEPPPSQVSTEAATSMPSEMPQAIFSPSPSVLASPSLESSAAFTPTDRPTDTSVPSATPSPNLFVDDFSDGLGPAWTVVFGKPLFVNGRLTANETTLLSLGDATWTDYQIEFDVEIHACVLIVESDGVGVRATDFDNMIFFAFSSCDTYWIPVKDGTSNTRFDTHTRAFYPDHVTIKVEGHEFTVHEKTKFISSITDADYPTGYIFLRIRPNTLYDNFKITLLKP
jgi:hypothetical protein